MSKVILVTGASRGIGLGIAKALVAAKHKVVLTARNAEALEKLKAEYPEQVAYLTGNMTDYSVSASLFFFCSTSHDRRDIS